MGANVDLDPAQETEVGSQSESKQTDTVDWAAEARKWQSRYNGLQGHVNKVTGERDEYAQRLTAVTGEYEGKIADLNTQYQTATQTLQTLEQAKKSLEADLQQFQTKQATREFVKTFADEVQNPDIMEWYEDGLIVGLESQAEEDRKAYLAKLAEKLGKTKTDSVKDALEGATTPTPQGGQNPARTMPELKQAMDTAMRTGGPNSAEYKKAFAEYQQAIMSSLKR